MIGSWLSEQWWSYAISAICWGAATVLIFRGALLGAAGHARPRLMLGVFTFFHTIWFSLTAVHRLSFEWSTTLVRVTSWLIALSLAATAWTGVKFGQKVQAVTRQMEKLTGESSERREDDD